MVAPLADEVNDVTDERDTNLHLRHAQDGLGRLQRQRLRPGARSLQAARCDLKVRELDGPHREG